MFKIVKVVILLVPFLLVPKIWAIDPSWKYSVLRSPHFEVIYRQDQKELARRYALAGEQARELLLPIFKEAPDKTILVLRDNTDLANGLATFLPYPHIVIQPVMPASLEGLDEFGDWPLEIMVHEYTHILNMYPAHGFYWPLKYMFGTVVRPNGILPRWYLEGLAVNLESRLTKNGRLRSTLTRASARALALEGEQIAETIASINESNLLSWPFGARPYLYGGWWWEYVQQKNPKSVYQMNQSFSRRLPFLINGPTREATNQSASENWLKASAFILERAEQELDAIKPHSTSPVTNHSSGDQSLIALSPSANKLLFMDWQPGAGGQLKLKSRTDQSLDFSQIESEFLMQVFSPTRFVWINENEFIFDQLVLDHPFVNYRDLFSYNLETKELTRLTRYQRAQEPTVSPDGQSVAFVRNHAGHTNLSLLDLKTLKVKTLIKTKIDDRLYSPEFLSDDVLMFVAQYSREKAQVRTLDLKTNKIIDSPLFFSERRQAPSALSKVEAIRKTPSGLLFTAEKNSVRNAYLGSPLKPGDFSRLGILQVSSTPTDVLMAALDVNKQKLLISELTANGRRLRALPLHTFTSKPLPPSELPDPPATPELNLKLVQEDFIPLSYMWPRYWIPFVFQVEGGLIFQGISSTQDPIGRNAYSLLIGHDTVTNRTSYGLSYTNRSTPTEVSASYFKAVNYLGASGNILISQTAALSLTPTWPLNSRFQRWQLAGVWSETDTSRTVLRRYGPEISYSYDRLTPSLTRQYGFIFEFSHREFLPQDSYLDFGRTAFRLGHSLGIPNGFRLWQQTRVALSPRQPFDTVIALGDRNVEGNFLINLVNSQFLLRGYPSGTFVGRKMISSNLELIFPTRILDQGLGTFPWFLRNLEFVGFFDYLAADGGGFDPDLERYVRTQLGQGFTSAGLEFRLHTTAAYHIPLSLTLGLYYPFNSRFSYGFTPFIGIGMGSLGPNENKTP